MVGLGFNAYVAQGGDVGSMIVRFLAAKHPACKAAHLNFCVMADPPAAEADKDVEAVEKKALERRTEWFIRGVAYAREHGTRPSTIGLTLASSPVALLSWYDRDQAND